MSNNCNNLYDLSGTDFSTIKPITDRGNGVNFHPDKILDNVSSIQQKSNKSNKNMSTNLANAKVIMALSSGSTRQVICPDT